MRRTMVVLLVAACGPSARAWEPPSLDAGVTPPSYARRVGVVESSPTDSDLFGLPVKMSGDGDTLAISAIGARTIDGLPSGGCVYIYRRAPDGWLQEAQLQPTVLHAGDNFGAALGLSTLGDTLVVGAGGEASGATGVDGDAADRSAPAAGAAYVFKRHGGTWTQQAYLKASRAGVRSFGRAVAIAGDGNTVAIGAVGEDSRATGIDGDQTSTDAPDAGAVYVFATDGAAWAQQAYVKASNTSPGAELGFSVALAADGATLAVGAASESSGAGAVYLFRRAANHWTQTTYLKASNSSAGDHFGASLALSGLATTLVIGADGEAGDGRDPTDDSAPASGAAYVFELAGTTWSQQAYLKASRPAENDNFGREVAISGDGTVIAVRDPLDDTAALDAGAIAIFAKTTGAWQAPLPQITSPTARPGDQLGGGMALSSDGKLLVVGSPADDTASKDAGIVYVYY